MKRPGDPCRAVTKECFPGASGWGSTNHKCSEDHFLELGNSGKVGENLIPDHSYSRIQSAYYFGMNFIVIHLWKLSPWHLTVLSYSNKKGKRFLISNGKTIAQHLPSTQHTLLNELISEITLPPEIEHKKQNSQSEALKIIHLASHDTTHTQF